MLIPLLILAILPFAIQISYAGTPAGTITYSAATDTITVIGANSTHPAEFLDLYNADVAGGWNQVTMVGSTEFYIACKIILGNGSSSGATYFTDAEKLVTFSADAVTGAGQVLIEVKSYAVLTLGNAVNSTIKSANKGCTLQSLENSVSYCYLIYSNHGATNLYGCTFLSGLSTSNLVFVEGGNVWNCLFNGYTSLAVGSDYAGNDCNVYNVIATGGVNNLHIEAGPHIVDRYYSYSPTRYLRLCGTSATVSNVFGRGATVVGVRCTDSAVNHYLVDCNLDLWTFAFDVSSTVYRQYTLDLYVLNGALTDFVENANVTLSHDGAVFGSWLSNSTGQIATQTLTYGFYNSTGGNTMYGGTAWTLTITHPDWTTYTSVFYPYSKIEWSISMQDTSTADNNMVTIGLLLGGITFLGIIVIRRKQ